MRLVTAYRRLELVGVITDYGSYADAGERHSSAASPAGCRETVILVKEPDPDLKPGDMVTHEVGHKKIPVVVREILSIDQLHKCKLFKIFWRFLSKEEMMEMKTCPHCGKQFLPNSGRQEFCSVKCRIEAADKKRLAGKNKPEMVPDCVTPDSLVPEIKENVAPALAEIPAATTEETNPILVRDTSQYEEPEPEDKNIRAAKKLLKLIPKDEAYTLKISLEAENIGLNVTLIGGNKNSG